MKKEGVRIEQFDPKPVIQKNAENAKDWEYNEYAILAYKVGRIFKERIFDPYLATRGVELPDPVISFDNLRNIKTLAAYTLHRNPQGLLDEITFNTAHFVAIDGRLQWEYGLWAFCETEFHEQIHLLQENFLNKHKPGRVHHDKVFVELAESWGLHPTPVTGSHWKIADEDKAFGTIMKELGYEKPKDVPTIDWESSGGYKRTKDWFRPDRQKGRSTLHKWECPDCGLKVRVGINANPELVHDVCSEIKGEKVFLVRADGREHTIYKAK